MGGWDRACGCVEEGQVEVSLMRGVQDIGGVCEMLEGCEMLDEGYCLLIDKEPKRHPEDRIKTSASLTLNRQNQSDLDQILGELQLTIPSSPAKLFLPNVFLAFSRPSKSCFIAGVAVPFSTHILTKINLHVLEMHIVVVKAST